MQANLRQLLREMSQPEVLNFEMKQDYVGPLLSIARDSRELDFQCSPLFEDLRNSTSHWPPPLYPHFLEKEAFTMGSTIRYRTKYYTDPLATAVLPSWTKERVKSYERHFGSCGGTGLSNCSAPAHKYASEIRGKRGLVFNNDRFPWAEAGLLSFGATHVVTVANTSNAIEHPDITRLTAQQLGDYFVSSTFEPFDFVFSFSSFEHEGLGRYGDALRPSGDLESIARAHCLLKPNGILFLAVPLGPDTLIWNAHRIYGKYRLPWMLANWDVIDVMGILWGLEDDSVKFSYENRPIWVLRRKDLPSMRGHNMEVTIQGEL